MQRRTIAIFLLFLALVIAIITPLVAFTPLGSSLGLTAPIATPFPTPVPFVPTPPPSPTPVLTVKGTPPTLTSQAAYLLDMDTGHTLTNINGQKPLPMASTTKIMTALIVIQTVDPNSVVTIHQDAIDEAINNGGSSAGLVVSDQISLKDLLYGLMLPSGDDAAVAIADAVGGSKEGFVQRMNLFAYHLHLFQTHYANPDGLPAQDHYTTAADLVRLARYAMSVPLFAQIVQTPKYTLTPTARHHRYTWTTTNDLLQNPKHKYEGATGIKTGTTPEAGFCLVFSATRSGHHLVGVVLHSTSEDSRANDATALLNWGFGLPLLPPT